MTFKSAPSSCVGAWLNRENEESKKLYKFLNLACLAAIKPFIFLLCCSVLISLDLIFFFCAHSQKASN